MAFGRMWSKDRFGRDTTFIGLKSKNGKYPCGYVTIGNSLYKITTSKSNKEGVEEWVNITKIPTNNARW